MCSTEGPSKLVSQVLSGNNIPRRYHTVQKASVLHVCSHFCSHRCYGLKVVTNVHPTAALSIQNVDVTLSNKAVCSMRRDSLMNEKSLYFNQNCWSFVLFYFCWCHHSLVVTTSWQCHKQSNTQCICLEKTNIWFGTQGSRIGLYMTFSSFFPFLAFFLLLL